MASPITPGGIAAQVILKAKTGFPRDDVVNTFHFRKADITPAWVDQANDVADTLESFYNEPHGAGANPVCWYISSLIERATGAGIIKVYDLGQPSPRVPSIWPLTLGAGAGSDNGLPTEVSICGSYKGTAPQPRRGYGRVFIGPLHSNVVLLESPHVHMNSQAVTAVVNAMRYLITDGAVSRATRGIWSVYSRANNALYDVTSAWVDNEFDTQRRRGHRATARTFA